MYIVPFFYPYQYPISNIQKNLHTCKIFTTFAAEMSNAILIDIILPLAIADVYTYRVSGIGERISDTSLIGCRVLVPLGKKTITGVVYRLHQGDLPASVKVRDVVDIIDTQPVVTAYQLRLWQWMAEYYMCTLGEVMAAALPAGIIDDNYTARTTQHIHLHPSIADPRQQELTLNSLRRAKSQEQLLRCFLRMNNNGVERRVLLEASGVGSAVLRTMIDKGIFLEEERPVSRLRQYTGQMQPLHALDNQQAEAVESIRASWQTKNVTLLHGVTSSGKTEVYIHLIDELLKQGKQVLYLVPEIALTTQLTERLQAVFGNQVLVYHSRFSSDERTEIYSSLLPISNSEASNIQYPNLILGARSAIFLPFTNLGLVIVDEEHEPSYKQQDPAPRYHARSSAIMMAQWHGAKVLLGTATPSVESYHNALSGKYGLVEMTERFRGLQLPKITMVDLQRQYHRKEMYGHFADPVVFRIREEIAKGKQVILFQNRRGYAPFLQCPNCGEVPKCPNCDVSMTYHKGNNTLVCHSCGHTHSISNTPEGVHYPLSNTRICPKCGSEWRLQGFGTERLEEEIQGLFPNARVERMDLDTTRRKDAYQQIIDRFARHEVDILIGTQMVTKGLHFDDVSLVVVLQADTLVNQPDYRSAEHAFQMLEQVSGRAGRSGKQGEVMIQTFDPKNPLYAMLCAHDFKGLYQQQIGERDLFCFPPFHRLMMITLRHRDERRLEHSSSVLMQALRGVFGDRVSSVITPLVSRRQNQYIRQLRLRVEQGANVQRAKQLLCEQIRLLLQQTDCKGTVVFVDVDP